LTNDTLQHHPPDKRNNSDDKKHSDPNAALKNVSGNFAAAALDQMTREILPKHGLDPQRDVVLRSITRSSDRLPALLTGSVDAAVLSATDTIKAKEQGCHELLFYGDELEFISGGVVVNNETLSKRHDFVRRFLRATLKSFQWFKTNEKEPRR